MRHPLQAWVLASVTLCGTAFTSAEAQVPGGTASPNAGAPAGAAPARPANLTQVLATVNNEPITRGDLYNLISRYPLPAGEEAEVYQEAVNVVANTKLVNQFLVRQRVPVSEKELADRVALIDKQLQKEGTNIKTRLAEGNSSEAELKASISSLLAWQKYATGVATDPELKRYAEANKDLFGGTQVRASIIFLKADEDASAADKAKAKEKLLQIRSDILAKKISFADAANKFSEDPRNVNSPSGGDLGYFRRRGDVFEELATAAFSLKPGEISQPIETAVGLLIAEVADRKDGKPIDFEQQKNEILAQYTADLQEKIIAQERKAAKIEIKPMPADFFPKAQPQPGAPATKGAAPAQVK